MRLTTPDDYYVVRANALEDNVRFYRVVKGRREQLAGANTKVVGEPVAHAGAARPKASGSPSRSTAKRCSSAQDRTFPDAGKVALWTKADSVTYFDTISITPLK